MSNGWYIGQKVVCLVDGNKWMKEGSTTVTTGWWIWKKTTTTRGMIPCTGPGKGDVCIIAAFNVDGFIALEGWPKENHYDPTYFRPLDALTEQIERIEKEGAPIEQPQPELA